MDPVKFINTDKLKHFTVMVLLTSLFVPCGLVVALGIGTSAAIITEVAQKYIKGRQPDGLDFIANQVGILTTVQFASLLGF